MQNKVRSTCAYWYEYRNGDTISVRASLAGKSDFQSHQRAWKEIKDETVVEVNVYVRKIDSVIKSPFVGMGMACMSVKEQKKFTMTAKEYKELVVKFWENGHEYYNQI